MMNNIKRQDITLGLLIDEMINHYVFGSDNEKFYPALACLKNEKDKTFFAQLYESMFKYTKDKKYQEECIAIIDAKCFLIKGIAGLNLTDESVNDMKAKFILFHIMSAPIIALLAQFCGVKIDEKSIEVIKQPLIDAISRLSSEDRAEAEKLQNSMASHSDQLEFVTLNGVQMLKFSDALIVFLKILDNLIAILKKANPKIIHDIVKSNIESAKEIIMTNNIMGDNLQEEQLKIIDRSYEVYKKFLAS